MKNYHLLFLSFAITAISIISCSKSDDYMNVPAVNVKNTPYAKLSEYDFFKGELKNLEPNARVLPYEPASSLFADFAHKKRFVYFPENTVATYNGDDNVFIFPVGAVLIKSFYYDNVQPNNTTQIIETRLLINKADGWHAYDYIWNAAQNEATLETTNNGVVVPVSWLENGVLMSVNYETPSQTQCITCHKLNATGTSGGEKTIPIGPKPQNLNTTYNYNGTPMNQIAKWKAMGFLGNDVPANINSTVNWRDGSQPLELRVRSYIDINCAHCHRTGAHCDYVPQRFNFSNPDLATFGVCLPPVSFVQGGPFVINGGNASASEMIIRMSSTQGSLMMPIIGRTLVDEEGVQLIKDWINSLPTNCR